MWYLVLYISGAYAPAMAIIPEKYPTEEACHAAANGKAWSEKWSHGCIAAPTPQYIDAMPQLSFPKSLMCNADGKNCKPNY